MQSGSASNDTQALIKDINTMSLDLLKLMREQCRIDRNRAIAMFGLKSDEADFLISASIDDLKNLSTKMIPGFTLSKRDKLSSGSDSLVSLLNSNSVFK